ncbi:UNVERIFIED_CONTAM: hypothetical protein FKN15_034607 [Acipenser sinensis]
MGKSSQRRKQQQQQQQQQQEAQRVLTTLDVCLTCLKGEEWCFAVGEVGHVALACRRAAAGHEEGGGGQDTSSPSRTFAAGNTVAGAP